jgi:isopenicillin-N N-acyltransferase-like protein
VRWKDEYLAYVRYQVVDPKWPGVMRGVGLTTSKDFEHWTPKEVVFTTDAKDNYPWTQPYALSVTPYGDQLIGILLMLHLDKVEGNNSLGDEDTQLVVSRDGRNWSRVAGRATFLESTPDSWDEGRIHAPAASMVVKDDVVHIYYSASDTRHGSGSWGTAGIGLATLPADRFVALRQQDDGATGELQTRLIEFSGDTLLINADVDGSDLQVELLDKSGQVLAGFDRHRSRLIRHDKLRYRVVWGAEGQEQSLGDAAKNQPLALRFILNGGALYAFRITIKAEEKSEPIELSLEGSPYERGLKHGQRFAKEIQESIDHFKNEVQQRTVVEAVNKTVALLGERFPEVNEEIRGIADGAKVPFLDAFLFNNRAIVSLLDQEACSNIAVKAGDAVILGMNKDRPSPIPAYDKYFLKKVYPKDGHAYISYGHVGRIWGHGMNEKGLCTAGTAAHPEQNKAQLPSVGSYFLPPLLLSKCKDVPEALEMLKRIDPVCDSGNFLLCDAAGEMVVVEITPEKRVFRKPEKGRITATTFFASGEIPHRNDPTYLREAQQRFGTIKQSLNNDADVALEDMKAILRSHREAGPVCLHEDGGISTVLSWIALPRSQEFYFCEGPPCQGQYRLYKLKD